MLDTKFVTPANIVSQLKGKTFTFEGRTISIPDEYFSTGTERKPFKNEFQPRFGFSYDIFGNSKSVVYGGWGKYYDRLFLNSTLNERFNLQFPSYRFHFSPDGSSGTKWDPSYLTIPGLQSLIAQGAAQPIVFLLSNNTKPPYSTQYNIGYRQAFGSWLASAGYDVVRAKRAITFVAASGFDFGSLIPGFGYEVLNDPVGKSYWYDGESITLDRPYTSQTGWGARFVYNHAKALQNGNDLFSYDLPSASLYARHPVPGTEPNHFIASGIFRIPWDMRFSTNVTLGSGGAQPIQDFSQGFDLAGRLKTGVWRGALYPPKSGGFGYRDVDFRLEKDFGLVGRANIGLVGEVFNAFNFTNYGCLLPYFLAPGDSRSNLGKPTCVVTLGRREQVGLKLNF